MADEKRSVEFLASFPHKAGAVDFHGDAGVRITLDVPEQYKPQTLNLPAFFFNQVLRVTITIED
jgi:hypothetical protein